MREGGREGGREGHPTESARGCERKARECFRSSVYVICRPNPHLPLIDTNSPDR